MIIEVLPIVLIIEIGIIKPYLPEPKALSNALEKKRADFGKIVGAIPCWTLASKFTKWVSFILRRALLQQNFTKHVSET